MKLPFVAVCTLLAFQAFVSPASAQTTLTPSTLPFGKVVVSTVSGTKTAIFKNTQTVPLTISSIVISGGNASSDYAWGGTCPISPNTLGAGLSCNITVTFTPSALGSRTSSLTITHSASNSPQSVALTGTGIAPVLLTPAGLGFGSQIAGTTSAVKTVTLQNNQTALLTISSIVTSGGNAPSDYAWGGTCPISPNTLGTGLSCSITVTFTPSALGSRTSSLTVTHSASNSPQSVALSGSGAAPVTLSANNRAFASRLVGTTSGVQTVTVTNNLNTQLLFSSIAASGDFAVASNTCGSGIGAGLQCTIGVTFTPTALGLRQGTLTINYNAFGSPSLVALSGTGNDAGLTSITVSPANSSIGVGATQQFTATGHFSNGNTQNLTPYVAWSSSASGVATITAGGLATGVTTGSSSISATLGSITGSTTLTVTPPVLQSIAVTPTNASIALASTQQFTATGTFSDGSTQNLTSTATWSSSTPSIATVRNASGSQGLASAVGSGSTTITATSGAVNGSTTLTVSAGFVLTGSLNTARGQQTATLLNNGMVLLAGGAASGSALASAELYNPAIGNFANTGSLNTARDLHTATLLNNAMVLLVGGVGSSSVLASAELYNAMTGSFTLTGSLNTGRQVHTATLLNNGMVLIAGGQDSNRNPLGSAELYNPATGTFAFTGNLNTARDLHTATPLNSGMVLIAGGVGSGGILASAELYNPATSSFTLTGHLNTARQNATATLLNNGMVLIAGGQDSNGNALGSAELYNPAGGTFTLTGNLNTARDLDTATLLNNGMVLIAGGDNNSSALASAELYSSAGGTFALTGNLNASRQAHTATLLNNGTVLMAGGNNNGSALASAELYEAATLTPPNLVSISLTPSNPVVPLNTAQQLIATGTFSDNSTEQLVSVSWSSSKPAVISISDDATDPGSAYALALGSATVSACAGSVCGSTTVTTPPPALVSIAVTPANGMVAAGSSLQFDAIGTYSNGSKQDLTVSVTWNSSTPGVATITAGGLATGVTPGNSSISATMSSITGSTSLTVNPPTSVSIAASEWLEFLGDGSEGAYSCTSGTCLLGGEHWVSSFDVSAGASVVTSGQNTPIVIRSTGACAVAGSISNSPNSGAGVTITGAGDFGGGGGGGGGGTAAGQVGRISVGDASIEIINGGLPGAAGGGVGQDGGSTAVGQYQMLLSGGTFWPVGGSVGGAGGSNGGAGGWGGSTVILVCSSINFTGTIDVSGGPGGASPGNNSGAGGGGGAGYVIFSAVSYTANTGTINTAAGPGGSCNANTGCGAGGKGGNGWNKAVTIP
jgi:hypothetical protein